MSEVIQLFGTRPRLSPKPKYPSLRLIPAGCYAGAWVYAMGFTNGIVKVGFSSSPRERLTCHVRDSGGAVDWLHVFERWNTRTDAIKVERQACDALALIGEAVYGREWFRGIDRAQVMAAVRLAQRERRAKLPPPVPAKKPRQRRAA